MKTIKVLGHVDEQHRLHAKLPAAIPPGPVEVDIHVPASAEESEGAWQEGVAREWAEELNDTREDIYTLADGEPVDESK